MIKINLEEYHYRRIKSLQKLLKSGKIEAVFLTNSMNIRYLTNLITQHDDDREFYLIVTQNSFKVFCSHFFEIQAKNEIPKENLTLLKKSDTLTGKINKFLTNKKTRHLVFEPTNLKFSEHKFFSENLDLERFEPSKKLVEKLREIKDKDEISLIEKAQEITIKTWETVSKLNLTGKTEIEVSRKIDDIFFDLGAEGRGFDTIVAFGKNSAIPHHISSTTKIEENGILLIDLGAKFHGYSGDFTRTIYLGKPTEKFKKLHQIVQESRDAAIKKVKSGVKVKTVFDTANNVLKKAGLDENFTHMLGHGVGLEIHESPGIYPTIDYTLKSGNVITIEPGIYFQDWGGIRIEDMVFVE